MLDSSMKPKDETKEAALNELIQILAQAVVEEEEKETLLLLKMARSKE